MSSTDSAQIVKLESIEILPSKSHEEAKESYHGSHNQFKCTLCPLEFNDKQEFQSHVRDHFKPITCKECNKTFIGDKQYSYHQKHYHTRTKIKNESSEMEEDLRKTTKIEIGNEYIEYITSDSVESQVESVVTNVACDVCGRLFPNIAAVTRHRKTHTNEGKRFFCNVCNNGFNKKTNLEFHLRIHTNERPYTCDQCPKSFSHVSGLNCHRRIHTGERPYTCPFCPKSYAHSTDLRRHRRTHGLEEKRFACEFCQKQFFENKFLRSHMRTHHRNETYTNKAESHVSRTSIDKSDECVNEEYIDYEYIHSD